MSTKRLEPHDKCPGGTGKPIRDCGCRAFLSKLDAVDRAIEGKQYRAAREQLERLIDKHGSKPCLVMYHFRVLGALDDLDAAAETVQKLLDDRPHFAPALAKLAFVRCSDGTEKWADDLVEAFEHAETGPQILNVFNSARAINELLGVQGKRLAQFAWSEVLIRNMTEEVVGEFIEAFFDGDPAEVNVFALMMGPLSGRRFGATEEMPLAAREELDARLQQIAMYLGRGKMRSAAKQIEEARAKFAADLRLESIAIRTAAARARTDEVIRLLRECAENDSFSELEKVWIESVAQFEESTQDPHIRPVRRFVFDVRDAKEAIERLRTDPRMQRYGESQRTADGGHSRRPIESFLVFTESAPQTKITSVEDALQQLQPVLGKCAVFEKTTSDPAQVCLNVVGTEEDGPRVLRDILGDLVETEQVETLPLKLPDGNALFGRIREDLEIVASSIVPEVETKLAEREIMEMWPHRPHFALGGKTPTEAAEDPTLARRLAAAVWNVEVYQAAIGFTFDFNALRRRLGIPEIETFDPWQREFDSITIAEWMYVDPLKVSKEECIELLSKAHRFRHRGAMKLAVDILQEVAAETPSFIAEACFRCARFGRNPIDRAEWFGRAAKWLEQTPERSPFVAKMQQMMEYYNGRHGESFSQVLLDLLSSDLSDEEATQLMEFIRATGLEDYLLNRHAGTATSLEETGDPSAVMAADGSPARSKLWLPGDP